METDVLTTAIETVGSGAAQYGWLGALSGILSVGIGVFKFLFPSFWSRQKRWVKLAWIFGTSAVGAGILSALGGIAIPAAIAAALLGGLSAIGGHQVKKSGEEILRERKEAKAKKEMEAIGHRKGLDLAPKIMTTNKLKDPWKDENE